MIQAPSNFSVGDPYGSEQFGIERQRRLAEALQAQSQQPLDTNQSVGGWAIPVSPLAGLAKALNSYTAGAASKKADEREKALGERYQSDLARALTAASPHPEAVDTSQQGTGSMDMSGTAGPEQRMVTPDRQAVLKALMSHPATQQMALQQMGQDMQRQQMIQALRGGSPQATQGAPGGAPAPGMPPAAGAQPGAPTQAQTSNVGGAAGGVPMEAWLQADPSGKSYMEQLAKDQAAISTRYGIFQKNNATGNFDPKGGALPQGALPYQFGPNGQVDVSPYPGQVAGAAALTGAQAAAKVPYENVTTAGGASMPAYMAPGFKPPPMPGQPTAPQQKVTGEAPTDAAALQAVQMASARGQPATISGPDPWETIPKRQIPQGIGQTTFDKGMQEHQATKASELSTKYGELADHANQRMALNNQALSLVDKADTGPMAAQVGTIKNWLVSNLGIPEDRFANTPSATTALQKDLLNAATQKAKQQFGSRMTQSEVLLMLSKGSPNVDMPKAAIKYLIGTDNATAQYQIKQANDLGQYLQKGGDPMRFDSWYAQTFPLAGATEKVHLNTGANASAQEVADEMRRRGLIK